MSCHSDDQLGKVCAIWLVWTLKTETAYSGVRRSFPRQSELRVTDMRIKLEDLVVFQEICRKICINIPDEYVWKWDEQRQMAVIVLSEPGRGIGVFFPFSKSSATTGIFHPQRHRKNPYLTISTPNSVSWPGQVFFTSQPAI